MTFLQRVREWSAAVAFAEVGEFDEAARIARISSSHGEVKGTVFGTMEKLAVAAAFAEGGLFREASELIEPVPGLKRSPAGPTFLDVVGLKHVPSRMYVTTT